jgi:hypothetical protein
MQKAYPINNTVLRMVVLLCDVWNLDSSKLLASGMFNNPDRVSVYTEKIFGYAVNNESERHGRKRLRPQFRQLTGAFLR